MGVSESADKVSEAGSAGHDSVSQTLNRHSLAMKFESLGGNGHGPEFAIFQQYLGGAPAGLLTWADLSADLLTAALEARFDGVGLTDNTIVFTPGHSDEWWTKDKRYWMAMRSFVNKDHVGMEQATALLCTRLQSLRQKLIDDLTDGDKIFVFKTMRHELTDIEMNRLHAAIRAYGNGALLCVGYASEAHAPGTVEVRAPGLLVGYIDHFSTSADNKPLGLSQATWMALCERAVALQAAEMITSLPPASVARGLKTRPARKIVLIGNCQMQAMAGLYKRFVTGRSGDIIEHVPSYQDLSDENRAAIQEADVVVEQLFDLKPQVDSDAVPTTTPRLFIPMVTAAFLWPFAGSPHPKNSGVPFLTGGPYGGEASDSYLNRLILAGINPEEALETYINLDVNSRVNLERLFELVIDRQRSRDEAAGYRMADLMERHFRSEQIFLSPYHPNVRIATALAGRFFEQLGAERNEIDRMHACTRITPFPKTELPLHPSVCRHFRLDFVPQVRRYRFMNEGFFTFQEYVLRYMRYEWNDALEEGMHLSKSGELEEARDRLSAAARRSPLSAACHNALGHVFGHLGAKDQAIAAQRRAVEIEPDMAAYRANLGNMLRQARDLDGALTELQAAVVADPMEPHYRVLLAHLLRQRGDADAACDVICDAIRLDPYSASLEAELATCLEQNDDLEAAADSLSDAIALDPADDALLVRLAKLLGRLDRLDAAIDAARAAVAQAPDSGRARITLSELLLRTGDPTDALNEAYVAAVSEPDSAYAYGHLGHVLYRAGELIAAEAAFRRAARLDPRNAHFRHEISVALNRQDRIDEAIAVAREAAALEPANPHRKMHLASLIGRTSDLDAAQIAQREAVELEPEVAGFRTALSDLLARAGDLEGALIQADLAVQHNPNSVLALGQLAQVRERRHEFDQANETLRRALAIDPRNDSLLGRLASLRTRDVAVVSV